MIQKPDDINKLAKWENYEVCMPLNSNSDIFDHTKYRVKVDLPDEDDIRMVTIRYHKLPKEKL